MCGIIGFTGKTEASPILLDGLSKMEYRGYDSAGIAILGDKCIEVAKTIGYVSALQEKVLQEKTKTMCSFTGACGIGHTRWATHGAVLEKNAHPHISNDGTFAVCHNGIIENFLPLRAQFESKGYVFKSDTDTEVVVASLQYNYTGDFKKAFELTLEQLEGSYALAVICLDNPDTIYVAKKNAPLIIGLGKGFHIFASDVTAIITHTKDVMYLDDNTYACITPARTDVFSSDGNIIQPPIEKINWNAETAEKGEYEHFMLKEIMEQPAVIAHTLNHRMKDGNIILDNFSLTHDVLQKITRIVITACGSAYYAGCAGKYAIEKLFGKIVTVELASELRYSEPLIDKNTLLIAISQSGETADTIAAIKECKARGAHVLSIVNVFSSTITKLSDDVLYTYAGPEIAVATTKGYTTQLALLYLFALYVASDLKTISQNEYNILYNELRDLPRKIEQCLALEPSIKKLASTLSKTDTVFFLGRNTDLAVAYEGALKLKEISYIHAESYASGELKHGSIALIDEHTKVVAICCNQKLLEKSMSNCLEVIARGADVHIIGMQAPASAKTAHDSMHDYEIQIPFTTDEFLPILAVIPLQLLAYHVAVIKKCNVDKPRNLAKSVTVE